MATNCHAGTPISCGAQYCDEDADACVDCLVDGHCEDNELCTDNACVAGACQFPPNAAPCNDLNWCTHDDVCEGGVCSGIPGSPLYGDVAPVPGDGVVDVDDLVCCLSGFAVTADCPQADIQPCVPDSTIDVDDLLALLEAFATNYLCTCPP